MRFLFAAFLFSPLLLLGYELRRRGATLSAFWLGVCMAMAVILMIVSEGGTVQHWLAALSWGSIPLHAAPLGFAVGIILADCVGAPAHAGAQAVPNPAGPTAPAGSQSGWSGFLSNLIASAQGLGIASILLLLAIVALVPPGSWFLLFSRVSEIEAGQFKVSLGATGAQHAASEIRSLARTGSVSGGSLVQSHFNDERLDSLLLIVGPPQVDEQAVKGDQAEQDFASIMARPVGWDVFKNAVIPPVSEDRTSTLVARDRAMLRQLGGDRLSREELDQIIKFAVDQEGFLFNLRSHVACLRMISEMTQDRQLLDYSSFHIVEQLFGITGTWMQLEKAVVLKKLAAQSATDEQQFPDLNAQKRRIELLQGKMFDDIKRFNAWGANLAATRSGQTRNSEDSAPLSATCQPLALNPDPVSPDLDGFSYAPYVVLFTAHLLAAIGDNQAAAALIADWYNGLDEIMRKFPARKQVLYKPMVAWLKLRVIYESLLLQKLSEHTPDSVPVRPPLYHFVLFTLFNDVTSTVPIAGFFASDTGPCRDKQHRWLQNLVRSYVNTIKDYLDLVNEQPVQNAPFNYADWRLMDRLKTVNLDCMNKALSDSSDLAAQRLQYVVTIGQTTRSWYSQHGFTAAATEDIHDAIVRLREAIAQVERAAVLHDKEGNPRDIRTLIFPDDSQKLIDTAKSVQRDLETAEESLSGTRPSGEDRP